jgi:glycerol-3-phosphate cytidylyltransferase
MILRKRQVVGYTTGVFDLFHVGHLNILMAAKSLCDQLIVGVSTDELVKYKNKKPVIPFEERIQIVRACKYVDVAVPQVSLDKLDAQKRINFDLLFVGDDWYGDTNWNEIEEQLSKSGVRVHYFPYTKTTSSTLINQTLERLRDET